MTLHAAHCFYDVHMGASHKALTALIQTKTKGGLSKGECAIFVSKAWNAAKILFPGGTILYHRTLDGGPMTPQYLTNLPTRIPSIAASLTGLQRNGMAKIYDSRVIKKLPQLKSVIYA